MSKKSKTPFTEGPVPQAALRLFQMAWQLENWLRTIVYVELRADRLDWEEPVKKAVRNWPPSSLDGDKRQHHMATHHEMALSFLTFGELWAIISNNWSLFSEYFPPEKNTQAKIDEIKTIRNRIAHFREPHEHDVTRFELFIADIDAGLRKFCRRYSYAVAPHTDPVAEDLEASWEGTGRGYEMHRPDRDWLYAPHPHRMKPLMHASLDLLATPAMTGRIYSLTISPGLKQHLCVAQFLASTRKLHDKVIHLIPTPNFEVTVRIPAVLGTETVVSLIESFLSAGLDSATDNDNPDWRLRPLDWPEYVLWPNHSLAFYDDDVPAPLIESPK